MGILLHALHIAMIVLGGGIVAVLLHVSRPAAGTTVRARRGTHDRANELRRAGSPEGVVAAAYRAVLTPAPGSRGRAPITGRPRMIRGASFGAVALGLGVAAHRLASGGWAPVWVGAVGFVVLSALGWWLLARTRRTWLLAALVTGSQLLLNAGFSAVAIFLGPRGASTTDWARLLFCYHVGKAPSAGAVAAARKALGPGAASIAPHGSAVGGFGVLAWAAVAHLVAAVVLGAYLLLSERRSIRNDRRGQSDVIPGEGRLIPAGEHGRRAALASL